MKILHTADLHLKNVGDERWEALVNVINISNVNKCDIITISGDLFDSSVDAEKIRPELRNLFSKTDTKILIIPGNHDKNVFKEGYHFGTNVEVLKESEPIEINNCSFWGLPFESYSKEDVLGKLYLIKNKIDKSGNKDKLHFLLIHGELLDALFSVKDFGEEGYERYMPFRLAYFDDIGINFVLGGHFHTNCTIREFQGGFFIYPGSPVSVTKKEIGKRKVVIIDTNTCDIEEIETKNFYYELKEIYIDPFDRKSPFDGIKKAVSNIDKSVGLILKINGYINRALHGIDELTLGRKIKEFLGSLDLKYPPQWEENYREISFLLEDELFKEFEKKLNDINFEDEKSDRIKELFIKAMIEAIQK